MIRFLKSTAFRIFAVAFAALLAGSVFAAASRSGASPLNRITAFVFSPASRAATAAASYFSKLPVSFKSSSVLASENEKLREEIDSLKQQLVDYEQAKHKNEFYQQFLELKEEHEDYKFAEAAVIGRDAADRFESFTLNKGTLSGIKVNDPVIYGKYLIGVVASATEMQCTVNTIMNPGVNVSAYEVRTRDLGFVTTTVALAEDGLCHMPGLSASTAVTVGGIVCTSGVGGIYPRDLIIGNVVDVADGTVDISARAIIKPGVDFSQITDVFIITDFNGRSSK